MTQAAGKGPHSTARAMLAWIEWALGNHEQARQDIEKALLMEEEALTDSEMHKADFNEVGQQPLSTFAAQVKKVLDARSYPRWVEVPKR
ncbi:tetratricopeptide repeat protein [Pseudoglutamicibacter cumminsii]|uniref:tetratricopeptide repeat protein n=1 Tax=Pseudoglutamicibacter cumminsii TaxID=156979 RepID=UPI002AB9F746|nr:tetratricopeptide repeat protein [Pseudoglutamicibacter cumminsii]MDZ3745427.1 tetratricopeptide repeat protein [Pseudoglutamicibacter cumminsii]